MSRPDIAARAAALREEGIPYVHATVVLADRPTSARPGDEALVFADGTIEGFVGGTCAESTVRAQGLALLDSGEPLLLRITAEEERAVGTPGAGDHPVGASARLSVHNPCRSGGTLEIFLEPVVPAPLVVVHGDGPIAAALVRLAAALGHQAAVIGGGGLPDLSRAAAVVSASHGRDEEEVLLAALAAGVPYVGLVASRKRGEGVVAGLAVDEAARGRVHTPAGLDIGARTPQEVALSILAEIVAERRRGSGRPVGERPAHAEPGARPEVQTDPVCGMSVVAVETSLHLDHQGARHWFCGSGCLRAFAADPGAFLTP